MLVQGSERVRVELGDVRTVVAAMAGAAADLAEVLERPAGCIMPDFLWALAIGILVALLAVTIYVGRREEQAKGPT